MKKIVAIALFIFWAITTAIITAGLVLYGAQQLGYIRAGNQQISGNAEKQNQLGGTTLTLDEIAKHNKDTDCWLVINKKVYDVSSYLYAHPGEAKSIIPTCGKEATQNYQTKDKTIAKDHSQQAYALLENYYIGDLNQTIKSTAPTSSISSPVGSSGQPEKPTTNGQAILNNVLLSMEEVAKHNILSDCWMVLGGKVYNFTSYFTLHPGGTNTILTSCGADGSSAYATKGGKGSSHSSFAASLLPTFYLGDLNQVTSASTIETVQNKVQQDIQSGKLQGGDEEEEFEDD